MIQTKPINAQFDGIFVITAFASTAASSAVFTTALTTAVASAGKGSTAVPLQVATSSTQGVIVNTVVEIFDTTSKDKIIADYEGNEVYGKITEAIGVYTLNYHYLDNAGVEQNYTFAATNIDIAVLYRYDLETLPQDFAVKANTFVSQDGNPGNNTVGLVQQLTVTGTNTVTGPTIPANNEIKLVHSITINGVDENLNGMAVAENGTVTVTPGTLGYNVYTTDFVKVVAEIGLI